MLGVEINKKKKERKWFLGQMNSIKSQTYTSSPSIAFTFRYVVLPSAAALPSTEQHF